MSKFPFTRILIVFVVLCLNPFVALSATKKINVCYVTSNLDSVLPRANDLPLQFSGYLLAFKDYAKHINLIVYNDERENSIIYSKDWIRKNNCFFVVGIVSSKDSILAGPILKELDVFGFSSTSISEKADKFASHFRSLSISSEQYIYDLINFANKARIVVLHDQASLFSQNLKETMQKKYSNTLLISIDNIDISKIRKDDIIFYTTYPFSSIPSLIKLGLATTGQMIVGNPAWGETHTFMPIKNKLPHNRMFFLSPFWKKDLSEAATNFKELYTKEYQKEPDYDSYYDFEVGKILLSCLIKNNWSPDKKEVYSCIRNLKIYEGITNKYNFTINKAHPKAKQLLKRLL